MFFKNKQNKQYELTTSDLNLIIRLCELYQKTKYEDHKSALNNKSYITEIKKKFQRLKKQEKQDIKYSLYKINSRLGIIWTLKTNKPFSQLNQADQQRIILTLEKSFNKKTNHALRTLSMYISEITQYETILSSKGYKFQNDYIDRHHLKIEKSQVSAHQKIKTDIVIIGSGAGGAVAAAVLSKSGHDVVLIEKGPYLDRRDFAMSEALSRELFDSAGIKFTKNKNMFLLSGSVLGGGSVLGWTSSFAVPLWIRNQWDSIAQLNHVFSSQYYSNCEDIIKQRLNVNDVSSRYQMKEQGCIKGLEKQGLNIYHTPRNVVRCDGTSCGFCVFGCKKGYKQSTLETWIRDAYQYGTKFFIETMAKELIIDNKQVTGIKIMNTRNGDIAEVVAKKTILAAGSLATPVIMQRSNLTHPKLGKQLSLQPTALVAAKFESKVYPWKGTPQGFFCDDFLRHDTEKHGYLIQSIPLHPARFMSWFEGILNEKKQQLLNEYLFWTGIGITLADRGSGYVKSVAEYDYECGYQLGYKDQKNLRHGLETVCRALYLGGAEEILISTNPLVSWHRKSKMPIESFLRKLTVISSKKIIMGSTQQMGTAAMGIDPKKSICNADGKVHMVDNLYIMDGSVLPRSSGVPPEVAIQTIAYMNACKLAK